MTREDQRFNGQVVLVTGAASGIGRETSLRLAAEGAVVWLTDVDEAGARQAAEHMEGLDVAHTVSRLDIRNESEWETVLERVLASNGRLDVIVNCAGISAASPLDRMPFSEWRRVFDVNVDGAFLATKHGLRAMRASGGSIVHVSSASGVKAAAGACAYSASKAAVCMLAKVAAKECRDNDIPVRVNTVCPGGVKTPMWNSMPFFRELVQETGSEAAALESIDSNTPGGLAQPADVVAAILFLASEEARHINGIDLVVDGGYIL